MRKSVDLIVLIISLVITFGGWKVTQNLVTEQKEHQISSQIDSIVQSFALRLDQYERALDGARGLFGASVEVEREEFSSYFQAQDISTDYPGVYSFTFISKVAGSELEGFITNLKEELAEKNIPGSVNEEFTPGDEHYVVNFIAYEHEAVPKAYGFDLMTDKNRRQTLEAARDSGEAQVSGPLTVVGPDEAGFIISAPIYKNDFPVSTPFERREALIGFVNQSFLYDDLFGSIFASIEHDGILVHISDQGEIIFESNDNNDKNDHHFNMDSVITRDVTVLGHDWEIEFFRNSESGVAGVEEYLPNIVLTIGIFVSLLLFGITFTLSSSHARAVDMADKMTRDLRVMKTAVDSSFNHMIITDVNGKITYANKSVERITGYESKEIIGSTPKLWGGIMSPEFYRNMWHTIKVERKSFEGVLQNKRKDGTVYDALVAISPIISEDNLIGFVGVEADVSQQKAYERSLISQKDELERVNKLMVGRELKMIELKREIEKLRR